ncbi:MAG: ABC transporter substrate binding protein, partial [Burkholderiales bacterium]|nr:ABC transporter substrate binding protein [Burkholderiales bacterium]
MNRRRFILALGAIAFGSFRPALGQTRATGVRIGILGNLLQIRGLFWKPLFEALHERGWREGADYALEVREAMGDPARMVEQAKELVGARVDVLLAIGGAAGLAARNASRSIPVVTWCGYPVEAGLAASLARPGGNVTGVASYASAGVWGKFV